MSANYMAMVLCEAVNSLATGDKPARQRLSAAAITLTTLREDELPEFLRKHCEEVMYSLTADPRTSSEGAIESTLETMKAKKIKETI